MEHLETAVEMSWPSTRTLSSRPPFSNSQAYNPPWVVRRRLMQLCPISSCGVFGSDRFLKYDGAPTTAMRMSGPMRTAIMSFATCSPARTPASKRWATISIRP